MFVTEVLGGIPGLTGLIISSVLSATLSTFSSGVNSMATVMLEDIYKRLSSKNPMSNERQVLLSKILCKYSSLFIDKFHFIICRLYSGSNWLFYSFRCFYGILFEK